MISGLLVLGDIALGWSRKLGELDGRVSDPTPIAIFVGQSRLMIPANMFRFENQRAVGPQEHVELSVSWPEMKGFSPDRRSAFLDGSAEAPLLFLTIKHRDTATDSAGRLANIYQHFFEDGGIPAPDGLVGARLNGDSGLPGEEVFFEAGSRSRSRRIVWRPTAAAIPRPASPRSTPAPTSRSRSASARACWSIGARSATASAACS